MPMTMPNSLTAPSTGSITMNRSHDDAVIMFTQ